MNRRDRQAAGGTVAAVYRESLRKNLQHRLEVARRNGNEKLIRQLEAEAQYLRLDLA